MQCGTDNTHLALLEEYTSSCGSNSVFHLFEVVNNGSPVTLSDLTIKFWPYDTSGVALVGQIATGGCLWNPTCSHNITGVSMSGVSFSPACGPTTNQMANWEMTISTTDNTVLSGGTSWVNLETLVRRSDSQPFVPGTSHWYSQCVMTTSYSMNSHYAIYLKGNLVTSSGGIPPSCRPLPTCTPHTGSMAPSLSGEDESRPTSTPTPVPTGVPALLQSVVAAPNISTNGEPIRFLVNLNSPARIILSLYAITGEKVYEGETQGQAGQNVLTWNLQNQFQEATASGLYVYTIRMDGVGTAGVKMGKVIVLR